MQLVAFAPARTLTLEEGAILVQPPGVRQDPPVLPVHFPPHLLVSRASRELAHARDLPRHVVGTNHGAKPHPHRQRREPQRVVS